MAVVDANDLVLGRMATQVAKRALLGEKIDVVNCEKAVITGDKKTILKKYQERRARGIPSKGPFFPRQADKIVRRTVRGMLPYKRPKGRDAFKRVKCHVGVPAEYEGKLETLPNANISKLTSLKYIRVGELSKLLGAKI
jgi:large subunit ribosomal protein L13